MNTDNVTIQETQAGRLCGDCMKPIAVGEWCIHSTRTGRRYHRNCNPGKILFGDQVQAAMTPATTPIAKKGKRNP